MELSKRLKEKTRAIHYTFLIIFLLTLFGYPLMIYSTKERVEITIEKIEEKQEYAGRYKYLIYTKKHGVIKNSNSILLMKYNCENIQKKLKNNKTYEVTIIGLESKKLGLHKNIVKIYK